MTVPFAVRLGCQHAGGHDLEIVWSRHPHVIEGARRVGRVAKGGRLRQRPAIPLFPDGQDRIPVGQHPGPVAGVAAEDAVGADRVGRHGRGKGERDLGALPGVDRGRQWHAQRGVIERELGADRRAIDGDIRHLQTALSIVESIGEETEPDVPQRLGGRVAPGDTHLAADRADGGVERDVHANGAELVRRALGRGQRLGNDVGKRIDHRGDRGRLVGDNAWWRRGVPEVAARAGASRSASAQPRASLVRPLFHCRGHPAHCLIASTSGKSSS